MNRGTFSIHYISRVFDTTVLFSDGFRRDQLQEAVRSFRFSARAHPAFAAAWLLKRGRKTIAHIRTRKP